MTAPLSDATDAAIVAVLREYGPMTRAEIAFALDLSPSRVETALRRCPEIVRQTSIPPYVFAAKSPQE